MKSNPGLFIRGRTVLKKLPPPDFYYSSCAGCLPILISMANKMLNDFFVDAKDREYQFWKRNFLSIDLWTEEVFIQKLNYIHNNPISHPWNLVQHPEEFERRRVYPSRFRF